MLGFADAVSAVTLAARRIGLVAPSFRSPPARSGALRTIRRESNGSATIAVRVIGRPMETIERDLVEGVLEANQIEAVRRDELRRRLLGSFDPQSPAIPPTRIDPAA